MQKIPFYITPLASTRSLLSLTGSDASKFLQGLVTNDVTKPQPAASTSRAAAPALYAGFLSAQGRVQHDTFILPQQDAGFIIDFPKHATNPPLPTYIKRYILRSKVKAKLLDDEWRLWAIFPNALHVARGTELDIAAIEQQLDELSQSAGGKWWRDSRNASMGYRLLLPTQAVGSLQDTSFESATPAYYTLLRTTANVPEAPVDLVPGTALPLESNMDLMGGVDYRKGCYIGQELTARTHHTGVIRKRVLPVRLSRSYEQQSVASLLPPEWSTITDVEELSASNVGDVRPAATSDGTGPKRPRPAGRISSLLRVRSSESAEPAFLGLALLRLETLDKGLTTEASQDATTIDSDAASMEEAGVNPAGGFQAKAALEESLRGTWHVKAFRSD